MFLKRFIKNARVISGIFFIIIVSGCSTAPQTRELLHSRPDQISSQHQINKVPFFAQQEYQCGPAALASLLNYSQLTITPEALVDKVYIPDKKGSLQVEMISTARSYGLLAYKLDTSLEALLHEINAGNPVLVFQNLSLSIAPQWHYAVIIGYDLNSLEFILHSGTIPEHRSSFSTFEKTWQRADHWAYVLVKPGTIPATANPDKYLHAAHALSQGGFKKESLVAYRAAVQKWPDHSRTNLLLANTEYSQANYHNAFQALKRELLHYPDNSIAWNNLAYVYSKLNCIRLAINAAECALTLSPENKNIRGTLDEMQELVDTDMPGKQHCPQIDCPHHQPFSQ